MTRTIPTRPRGTRLVFDGWILGTGTTTGTRVVLGHWPSSPLGAISDVMVQRPDGHRVLLAPSEQVAAFVGSTYTFDEVRLVDVRVTHPGGGRWVLDAGPLQLEAREGRRPLLGLLLRAVPRRLAVAPAWIALLDRPARLLTGLRTRGSAGGGRTEWYGVSDLHGLAGGQATWEGAPLGELTPVRPPVTFGFGSVPPGPAVVRVRTTVDVP